MCSLLYNVHLCLCNLLIYRSKLVFANVQYGTNIIETGGSLFLFGNWVTDAVVSITYLIAYPGSCRCVLEYKTACKYENYGGFRDKMSRWYLQIIVRLRNG